MKISIEQYAKIENYIFSCIDFENYKILEIGKQWNFDLSTEKKEDKFLSQWFEMITKSVFYLNSKIK